MEHSEHENSQSKIRELVCQHLESSASDDYDTELEVFEALVKNHGWGACYTCLIHVLLDEHAGYKLWHASAAELWGGILDKHPMEEDLVIGLVYKRLLSDEGPSDSNLAWSIAVKLKKLDYALSDYDPCTDPKVIATLERYGLTL